MGAFEGVEKKTIRRVWYSPVDHKGYRAEFNAGSWHFGAVDGDKTIALELLDKEIAVTLHAQAARIAELEALYLEGVEDEENLKEQIQAKERNLDGAHKLIRTQTKRIAELEAGLKPFAAVEPMYLGSTHRAENTWLWKPNRSKGDPAGIKVSHINEAKRLLTGGGE